MMANNMQEITSHLPVLEPVSLTQLNFI